MNTDVNLSELFDQYLENDMNILEKQNFELRLKVDMAFAERFRLHKEVDEAMIEDDILNFRMQLERIGTNNSGLLESTPMVIAEDLVPEMDNAILEQDIMALRAQLNRIHSSVVEEVDPVEISGYSGIERAILDQDSLALNRELGIFEELVINDGGHADLGTSLLNQDVDKAILEDDVMSLRAALAEIGERTVATKVIPIRRRVIRYASTAVAAVFLLVMGSSILFNQNNGSLTSERTISKYFQSYDGIGNRRGPSEESDRIIELGLQKYNDGKYADALEVFEACIGDPKRDQTILFYAGSSALNVGDPDKALRYFANYDVESPIIEQVEWFSAGCYLKKNDFDRAKAILNKIKSDPSHYYHNQATALLKKAGKDS